jgi:hypothetical protein
MACGLACHHPSSETHNGNTNTAVATASTETKASTNQTASASPAATTTTAATGSLATPTDAYKTAYEARKNKDVATLKRVMSADAIKFMIEIGEIEKKSLDDELKSLTEKPQNPSNATRNEKINGNRASLEYLNEDGKWETMEFVKDGNEWKLDIPKAG